MPKRIADKRLTDQNWDQDDDDNEILEKNLCKVADPTVLKKRVIMKAKRSIPISAKSQAAASSVFSNFVGLGHKQVGGFTLKGESSKAFQLPNQSQPKKLFTVTSDSSKNFFKSDKSVEKPKEAPKEAPKEVEEKREESIATSKKDYEEEFNCHLTALNKSVFNWIQKHIEENALVDLSPVFKDYSKHLRRIESKFRRHDDDSDVTQSPKSLKSENSPFGYSQSLESSPASQPMTSSQPVTSSQPPMTSSQPPMTSSKPPVSSSKPFSTFIPTSMTSSVKPPSANPLGDVIASSAPPIFSGFGTKSMTSSPHVAAGVFKGFTRSNDVTGSDAGSASTEEPQKEELPPVAESVQVHEEGAFYTKKCKLFYKHEDKYNEKGIGFLYLKPVTSSTKTQLLVRADTTVGTILLNILLEPNLPEAKLEGKNNVSLKCVPFPAVSESTNKLVLMLIRVKTSEDAKELMELINEKRREAMTS